MDFLKKHYEKILLGVVLLALVGAVAILPFKISSDKAGLEEKSASLIHPKVKPLTNLDLSLSEASLKRAAVPAAVSFSEPNKLFNPMPWQKRSDGTLFRADKVGPMAAIVTNITPLYLRLSLDSVSPTDTGFKYVIGVEKQAATVVSQRGKKQTYCQLNEKNDVFTLVEVKGKPEDPTALVVQLNDKSGERAVITKEQPYKRADGYMADVRYEPEKKSWMNRRANPQPPLNFNGEEYNIVNVSENEVVLAAKSNGKKWTLRMSAPASR